MKPRNQWLFEAPLILETDRYTNLELQPSPTVQTVKDVIGTCSTASVRGLSRQIIAEMNLLIPNVLVSINDLDIQAKDTAVNAFMQPAAKEALRRAIKKRGATLILNSAYRTCAQQHLLRSQFDMRKCSITAAATPGSSNHEDGLAIDTSDFAAWKPALESEGWVWFGEKDKVHFSYKLGGIRDDIGDIGVKAFQRLWNKNNPSDPIAEDGQWGPSTATRMNQSPTEGFVARQWGTPTFAKYWASQWLFETPVFSRNEWERETNLCSPDTAIYYDFKASFKSFVWLKSGALFKNPRLLNIEMANGGAYAVEVYKPDGTLAGKSERSNKNGGWSSFYLIPPQGDFGGVIFNGEYRIKLRNIASGYLNVKNGDLCYDR